MIEGGIFTNQELITKNIRMADGLAHLISLHTLSWEALAALENEGFMTETDVIATAWRAWIAHRDGEPNVTLADAIRISISEACWQYDIWMQGWTNDNASQEISA